MSESNGKSNTTVHQYNKVTFQAGVILPDAPKGEWEITFLHGKSKISPTQAGDPMVTFQVRLDVAAEDENESYQGTQLACRFIFPDQTDPKKAGLVRMTKRRLNDLASAIGFDLSIIPDVVNDPDQGITPETSLQPFVEAMEGRSLTGWTTHNVNKKTNEVMVDLAFSKPGERRGGAARDSDEE